MDPRRVKAFDSNVNQGFEGSAQEAASLEQMGPVATGPDLTALNSAFRDRPHEILDDLRTREPVHKDRVFDRVVLTRAADVGAVVNDRTLSSDPRKSRLGSFARQQFRVDDSYKPTMLLMDDPDHKRLRGLVSKAFSQRSIDALRPRITDVTSRILKEIPADQPFDLIALFARPLPTVVIAEILGIDPSMHGEFKVWSEAQTLMFNPVRSEHDEERLRWAVAEIDAHLLREIASRRRRYRDDLLTFLIISEEDGEKLTEAEIVSTCRLLLAAGNITTTDLIGNGVYALLRHPDQLDVLKANPNLYGAAIEEILRYDSPVVQTGRQILSPREIGGCPVEAGQSITALLVGANHDPELHENPHAFDIGRTNKRHFSFGGGSHFCLGAPLARLEGQIALSMLFQHFPALRLQSGMHQERKPTPSLSGFESLWVDPT
jgi:cytochrome P450